MKTHTEILQMIDNSDWNEPRERDRIIRKYFTGRPTIIKFLQEKFEFGSKFLLGP
jgi:hypothetical protein